MGHYSERLKFGRPGKSYYTDDQIDFKIIPKIILNILEIYVNDGLCSHFGGQCIFLNIRGNDYAIWFRLLKRSVKGGQENILRIQTFYPVEHLDDLGKIKKMQKYYANGDIVFYINSPT
jgi:hypothetical protein